MTPLDDPTGLGEALPIVALLGLLMGSAWLIERYGPRLQAWVDRQRWFQ